MLNRVRAQLLVSGQLKDEDKESKEHRESLRRNKSSSSSVGPDEEQDLASVGVLMFVLCSFNHSLRAFM